MAEIKGYVPDSAMLKKGPRPESKPANDNEVKKAGGEQEGDDQETQEVEEKGGFQDRYENISREFSDLRSESEFTFYIAKLQLEGLQTLVDEYGGDSVLDAIKKLNDENREETTTFGVVKSLEPDHKKRAELFKKMAGDAKDQVDKFDQQEKDGRQLSTHGIGEYNRSFSLGVELRVSAMSRLDSILGRVKTAVDGKIIKSEMRHFAVLFAGQEEAFRKQLNEAGGNTFDLVERRDGDVDIRDRELQDNADKLVKDVSAKIEEITAKFDLQLEEYRAKLLDDAAQINNVLQMKTDEMSRGVRELLSKLESEMKQKEELNKSQIAVETAELKKLLGYIKGLKRY